jgi:hypothetical protein
MELDVYGSKMVINSSWVDCFVTYSTKIKWRDSMKKDCMFQYGTNQRMLADTDLITLDEAKELFNKNRGDFINRLNADENPQMCIWINCATNESYGETLHNWYAEDFRVIDSELWKKV